MEQKILSSIKIGVGLIFILTPLAMLPGISFPLTLPKIIVFQVLTETVFVLWLALTFFRDEYKSKITPLSLAIFTFLIVVSLSGLFGVNINKSMWGLMDRGTGIVLLWYLFALYLVIKSLAKNLGFVWFAKLNVTTGAGISVIALVQRFLGWPASLLASAPSTVAFAPFSNSPFLAAYLIFAFFLGLWLIAEVSQREWRWIIGSAVVLNFIVIFLTETRGAIIGLATGLFVLLIYYLIKNKNKNFVRGAAVLIISAALLMIFTNFFAELPGIRRFYSPSLQKNLEQRKISWEIAWQGFKEKPLLGWGWENFDVVFWKYYDPIKYAPRVQYISTGAYDKPFNHLFEYLVSTGVIGLLVYLSIVLLAFYKLIKNGSKSDHFIIVLLTAYFVQNLALFDTIATYPLFFALLGFIDDRNSSTSSAMGQKRNKDWFQFAVLAALGLAILSSIYFINWKTVYAARHHLLAHQKMDIDRDFKASLDNWRIALKTTNPYAYQIQYDYAKEMRRAFDRGVEYDDWLVIHKEIINKLKTLNSFYPDNPKFVIELVNVYNSFSRLGDSSYLDDFNKALQKARAMAPNNIRINFAAAKNKILKDDEAGALAEIERAKELHPGLSDPRILLAIVYYQIGNKSQSFKEINNAFAQNIFPLYAEENIIFGDLSGDMKDYKKAINFYERALTSSFISPKRILILNTSLKLGLAYFLDNQENKAKIIFNNLRRELAILGEQEAYDQLRGLVEHLNL